MLPKIMSSVKFVQLCDLLPKKSIVIICKTAFPTQIHSGFLKTDKKYWNIHNIIRDFVLPN